MRDATGAIDSLLVLGGLSEIGLATARLLVGERTRTVILAVRDTNAAAPAAEDLRRSGARVEVTAFDADASPEQHAAFAREAFALAGDIDLVLVAFGVLGDQAACEREPAAAAAVVRTNFLGAVSILVPVAERLRDQGHGAIAVLSSVAGERPRRANFVYGSSKAGLDAFSQGLGDALVGTGVTVTVVRPGFVHTKMTQGLPAAPFSIKPEAVAEAIVKGVRGGAHTVWAPRALRWVMLVLRLLPRALFRRVAAR